MWGGPDVLKKRREEPLKKYTGGPPTPEDPPSREARRPRDRDPNPRAPLPRTDPAPCGHPPSRRTDTQADTAPANKTPPQKTQKDFMRSLRQHTGPHPCGVPSPCRIKLPSVHPAPQSRGTASVRIWRRSKTSRAAPRPRVSLRNPLYLGPHPSGPLSTAAKRPFDLSSKRQLREPAENVLTHFPHPRTLSITCCSFPGA